MPSNERGCCCPCTPFSSYLQSQITQFLSERLPETAGQLHPMRTMRGNRCFFVKGLGFPCLRRDIVSVGVPRQDNQDEARKRPDHQSRDVQGGHVANISECDEVGSHSRSSPQIPRCVASDVQGQQMVNSLTTGRGAQPLGLCSRV